MKDSLQTWKEEHHKLNDRFGDPIGYMMKNEEEALEMAHNTLRGGEGYGNEDEALALIKETDAIDERREVLQPEEEDFY